MLPPVAQLGEAIRLSSDRLGLKDRYDLGVLLVHGIGEQARGDTLTSQGDPFVRWLRGRVGRGGVVKDAKVDVLDSVVRHTSTDAIPGAHAVIRITPPGANAVPPTDEPAHWVVAEAWWAEAFRPATYGELAGWAVTIGPWVFATEVSGIARRMEIGEDVPRWLRLVLVPLTVVAGAALIVVAAVAGFLVTALAVALVVLAFTRIPFLADFARSLQQNLAGGFGDAYVLTRSPLRFAAMAGQVRAGLRALRQECDAVAVIAESMGTAVAWYALKHELTDPPKPTEDEREPAPVGLWLTHGQALRKLTFALFMTRGSQTDRQTVVAVAIAGLFGLAVVAFLMEGHWALIAGPVVAAIALELWLMNSALEVWESSGKDIEADWRKVRKAAPDLDWLDLWASADPFALGPLDVDGDRIHSYKIRNVGSTLADHTSYWSNTTEFLPIVASKLFRLGGPQRYGSALDDPRLEVPAMRRHARVLALLPLRTFVSIGVAVGLVYALLTPDLGRRLTDFVGSLNLPFIDGFFDDPPEWAVTFAGYILVLALGAIVWTVVNLAWKSLMREDEKTYFRGASAPLWTLWWYLLAALVVPIGAAVVALLLLAGAPLLAGAYLLAAGFMTMLGLAVLSGGGRTYASDEVQQRPLLAATRITGGRKTSLGVTAIIAGVLAAIPVVAWFWFRDAFPVVVAVELLVLSAILAVEAIREYRVFLRRFHGRSQELPYSAAGNSFHDAPSHSQTSFR